MARDEDYDRLKRRLLSKLLIIKSDLIDIVPEKYEADIAEKIGKIKDFVRIVSEKLLQEERAKII